MSDVKFKKDKILISRVNNRLKSAIRRAAAARSMSMSAYIEYLVRNDLKDRNIEIMISEKND